MYTDQYLASNNPQDQKRNLKPVVGNQNAYSASPSQLTLSSDIQHGLPNPYSHSYGYLPSPHDPTGFGGFGLQQSYGRPQQIQTQHHQPPPQHLQQQSPINSRKRRASELGDPNLPGSSSSNATAFGNPSGLMTAGADLDQTLGGVHQQQQQQQVLASPVVPKKGRTNTPWTPAEEQRLKTLRDAGSSWSEIAKTFPTRTEGSVKKHWYKVCCVLAQFALLFTSISMKCRLFARLELKLTCILLFLLGHALRGVRRRRGQQFRPPPFMQMLRDLQLC
jgi:hypothetical protein